MEATGGGMSMVSGRRGIEQRPVRLVGDGLDRLGGWLGAENKESGGGDGLDGC